MPYPKINMKVKFKKSAAPIGFGYAENEEADLDQTLAEEMVETGFADQVIQGETPEDKHEEADLDQTTESIETATDKATETAETPEDNKKASRKSGKNTK